MLLHHDAEHRPAQQPSQEEDDISGVHQEPAKDKQRLKLPRAVSQRCVHEHQVRVSWEGEGGEGESGFT